MKKEDLLKYGEICSKCWEDEAFKARFIQDPEGVLVEAGIEVEEGVEYKVIEAPKGVRYVILPDKNVREPVQNLVKYLLSTVDQVEQLVPEGTEIRVIQNTDSTRNLILPPSPKTMTAAELAQISGGKGDVVAEATNVAAHAEAVVDIVATQTTIGATTTVALAEVAVIGVIVLI